MSKNETRARAGTAVSDGLSPTAEVKTALTGFVSDIKELNNETKSQVKLQEERLTMLERKYMTAQRPALSAHADTSAPHQKAFDAYLRVGDDDALRGLVLEGKSMNTAVSAEGGYLVDPKTSETIKGVLYTTASIRSIASVVEVEATSYDVIVDHTEVGTGWANEVGPVSETSSPTFDRIAIPLHELSALPKASQRLLDDAAFDIESWLAGRIADKFARAEAAAFINGDGVDKPTGFLTKTDVANASWTWGKLGYVATGQDGDFASVNASDSIVDLVYALGAEYRANATFVMNSKTAGAVRKMKDADGRFLWSDGLQAGEPARLMGYPVMIAEDMPDIALGANAIAFGDFSNGYTIAERPDLRVLRDPFSAKPNVLFYATKRVGGDVSDFAAIKVLKFSVS
ncbi:phage major capsid protein [Falsihalocynthiibacter sp. S25ZX9]|uniref:phage major capsid protein n=1 Tax=Falsihalocynthiibacter sp. S25ZX9 TaxID=3240870 RepID=UPI00350ECF8E